jgi:WD40 repeat protein
MTTPIVISRPNPYVGPRPYKQGEILYGRERETSELTDLLIAERIVLLYSPSGAGKSSLLNAAILPKIVELGFRVLPVMRANLDPPTGVELGDNFNRYIYSCLQSIEEGLPENQRFSIDDLVKLKFKDYLAKYAERARAQNPDQQNDAPSLLIFDQTEEVIRISMTDREKKLDFFMQVGDMLRDRNLWALVAIREDYLASLDPYVRPIPTRLANRYRLDFLGADAAMQAIQRPAQTLGVEFPDPCASQLADDLRTIQVQQPDGSTAPELGPTVEPVQLQVVCRRLWEQLPETEKTVSLDQVKALGDANRALGDYYSSQVASVASMSQVPERAIREWFDRKLISASGVRGQVLMTPDKSDGLDNKVIWMLESAYLIRAEKRGGATWFELAHDRLVRPIRENNGTWFDKHLNVLQRQADVWNQQGRSEGLLVIGPDFVEMQKWAQANTSALTQVEKDFYAYSLKAHQDAVREDRANLLIRWLFVTAVIAVFVAVWFFMKSHVTEQRAVARELAAASLSNLQNDPELSLLLALDGRDVTTKPLPEVLQAIHQALPQVRVVNAALVVRPASPQGDRGAIVYSVDYSPDGKFLASAAGDGNLRIWEAGTLKAIKTLEVVDQNKGHSAFAVAYSPDGKSLATVGADGRLIVWDTSTWKMKYQAAADKGQTRTVAYSPDGMYIATGGEDGIARIWNSTSGAKIYDLAHGYQKVIETVTFSVDGTLLFAAGDDDNRIYAWNTTNGKPDENKSFDIPGDTGTVYALAVSPDGKLLASTGSDRLVHVWNLETKAAMEIPGHVDWVYALTFTGDSKTLISAGGDHTIRLWDTHYGRSRMILNGASNIVYGVSASQDGRSLASASADGFVRTWDISLTGSREVLTLDHGDHVYDVLYSPDQKYIASAGLNGIINLWDASTGALVKKLRDDPLLSAEVLSWSRDGRYIAAGYASGQGVIWDLTTAQPVLTIPGNGSPVRGLCLSPDDSLIAAGDDNSIAHVYNAKTGEEIVSLDANKQFNWIGSGQFDRSEIPVSALVFSPDGKYLATSYFTGLIVIWDWKSGKPQMTLAGHKDAVENFAYNADGSLLASASDDSTLILWDLNPQLSNHRKTTFKGHRGVVFDVAFSPDGEYLVSGGIDGLVKVWDVMEGVSILDLFGNTNRVHAIAFSPDGKHIISGSTDNTVRVFTLDPDELIRLAQARITRSVTEYECGEYLGMSCDAFKQPDRLRPFSDFLSNLFGW